MKKKILVLIVELALIALVIYAVTAILDSAALSEELYEAYVICQPNDHVNVRMNASRKSQIVGYVDSGDGFLTDGRSRNGFVKCYGIGEMGEGWIHGGYVVYDEPVRMNQMAVSVSNSKLRVRKHIGGKVVRKLKNLDEVMVYWWTDEWCVTDKGFVKSQYLEMEGN